MVYFFSPNEAAGGTSPSLPSNDALLERYRLLVEGATDYAMFLLDTDGRIVSWNEGAGRITGYEEADVLGQSGAIIFTPEDVANAVPEREVESAQQNGRTSDVRWHQRKDGSRFFADGVMQRLTDEQGNLTGFAKIFRDATKEYERNAQYQSLLAVVDIGFCVLEMIFDDTQNPPRCVNYRFLEANPAFERHSGLVNVVGKTVRELVPNLNEIWFENYGDVALTGKSVRFEESAPAMNRSFEVSAIRLDPPGARRVGVLFTNTTERKQTQEALQRSETELRDAQIRLEAAMSAGEIATWTFDVVNDRIRADANLSRLFSVSEADAAGGRLEVYLNAVHPEDRARVSEAIGHALQHEPRFEAEYRVVLPDGSHRWLVARGKVERDDTGRAISLPGVVLDITERKALEQERERLQREEQARVERKNLLDRIGAALRTTDDPEQMQATAVQVLGQALGVDRCFFTLLDPTRPVLRVGRDWRRSNLPSMRGEYPTTRFGEVVRDIFRSQSTVVITDIESDRDAITDNTRRILRQYGLRSQVAVAALVGDSAASILTVGMTNVGRNWTQSEIALVEQVATLTRSALESMRLQQRERTIATQLQTALLPQISTEVAGLRLHYFYQAAMEEAGVGGDFLDAHELGNGRTYLCVADLAGKGLAAAQQVALVKNTMLYAACTCPTLGQAVAQMDNVLVTQNLISGFATLFTAYFDGATRTLTYVNAGQEPALIYHSQAGQVTYLEPTGPVVGGFESAAGFQEQSVVLCPGDVFAVFTDGLTDVGPNRKNLLGVEGVGELFAQVCGQNESNQISGQTRTPRALVEALMAKVDRFGQSGARDDIALLVAVVR